MTIKVQSPDSTEPESKEVSTLSDEELEAIRDASDFSARNEDERVAVLIEIELRAINGEFRDKFDSLNEEGITPEDYRKTLKDIDDAYRARVDRLSQVTKVDKTKIGKLFGARLAATGKGIATALTSARGVYNASGGNLRTGQLPVRDALLKELKSNPITFGGAGVGRLHAEPTMVSNEHFDDKGIKALATHLGFTDVNRHEVINTLVAAYPPDGGSALKDWTYLLDMMADLWPQVKPDSAKKWARKALLSNGRPGDAHYRGMWAELREAAFIIRSGSLSEGGKVTLGKDKRREIHPALKSKTRGAQDVDLSFRHWRGERHYVEVKADPWALIGTIGGHSVKTVPNEEQVGDKDLLTTPDQPISYAQLRQERQGTDSKKVPGRYPNGKSITVTYVSQSGKDWLIIFTSDAARRLIKFNFMLKIVAFRMGVEEMRRIQDDVDKKTAEFQNDRNEKIRWAKDNSKIGPEEYLKALR